MSHNFPIFNMGSYLLTWGYKYCMSYPPPPHLSHSRNTSSIFRYYTSFLTGTYIFGMISHRRKSIYLSYDIIRLRLCYITLAALSTFYTELIRRRLYNTTRRIQRFIILKTMSNFTIISKHFNLGSGRVLFAQKKGAFYKIKIYDMGSDNRYVDFTIVKWASFVRAIDEV